MLCETFVRDFRSSPCDAVRFPPMVLFLCPRRGPSGFSRVSPAYFRRVLLPLFALVLFL